MGVGRVLAGVECCVSALYLVLVPSWIMRLVLKRKLMTSTIPLLKTKNFCTRSKITEAIVLLHSTAQCFTLSRYLHSLALALVLQALQSAGTLDIDFAVTSEIFLSCMQTRTHRASELVVGVRCIYYSLQRQWIPFNQCPLLQEPLVNWSITSFVVVRVYLYLCWSCVAA
jgi:hypothetical protein